MTVVKIVPSEGENPRENDNVSVMVCAHRRYSLGDPKASDTILEEIRESKNYRECWENDINTNNFHHILELAEKAKIVAYSTAFYMYDHSGLTVKSTPFSCPWDSGQIGYVIVTKKTAEYEYGFKRISKKSTERLQSIVEGEIEEYDNYLNGEFYGFLIEDSEGEHIDSCGGFLGRDVEKNGMLENMNDEYHSLAREAEVCYD
jgi:hypothetical protein